jgi:hypothetical protein
MTVSHYIRNKDFVLSDLGSQNVVYSSHNKYKITLHITQEQLVDFVNSDSSLPQDVIHDLILRGSFLDVAEYIKRNIEKAAWKQYILEEFEEQDNKVWFVDHVEISADSTGYIVTIEYADASFYALEYQTVTQNVKITKYREEPRAIINTDDGFTLQDVQNIVDSRVINLRPDGFAEGTEIKVPVLQINVEYYVSQSVWKTLKNEIYKVVGKVLNYEWGGFPARTILVDDLTVDARPAAEVVRIRWRLLHRPIESYPEAELYGFGSGLVTIDKPWDYRYVYALQIAEQSLSGRYITMAKPIAAIEGRIYPYTNLQVIKEPPS